MKKNILIIILSILFVGGIVFGIIFFKDAFNRSNNELIKYEEELLDIKISDCIEKATGKVNTYDEYEDYADIVFKIKDGKYEELKSIIDEKFSNFKKGESSYDMYEKMFRMKKGDLELTDIYGKFLTGKRAKTREVFAFFYIEDGSYYLYLMG